MRVSRVWRPTALRSHSFTGLERRSGVLEVFESRLLSVFPYLVWLEWYGGDFHTSAGVGRCLVQEVESKSKFSLKTFLLVCFIFVLIQEYVINP